MPEQQRRYPERERKHKTFPDYVVYLTTQSDSEEPLTYQEAVNCADKQHWLKTIDEELKSF